MKKDFDEIYEVLEKDTNLSKMNPMKNMIIIFGVVLLTTIVLFLLLKNGFEVLYISIVGLVIYICSMIFLVISKEKYLKEYKNNIISRFVSNYNGELQFNTKYDIGVQNFWDSELPVKFDKFISRDGVFGKISDEEYLNSSYVITRKKVRRMVDGKFQTENVTLFQGIFGFVQISNIIKETVFIKSDDFLKTYNKKRVELESKKFEKKFDCFSDNKIIALQLLTPDVIEVINQIQETLKVPIEFSLKGNRIYFRILIEDIYAPPRFSKAVNKKCLARIYNIIDLISKLSNILNENSKNL